MRRAQCAVCAHGYRRTGRGAAALGDQIMQAPGLNKSNAASLPLATETSYLEPNAAQIEAFQRNYLREQRRV